MSSAALSSFTSDADSTSDHSLTSFSSSQVPLDEILPQVARSLSWKVAKSDCLNACPAFCLEDYLVESSEFPFRHQHHFSNVASSRRKRRRWIGTTVRCGSAGRRINAEKLFELTRQYFNARSHLHHPQEEANLEESCKRREFIDRIDGCFLKRKKPLLPFLKTRPSRNTTEDGREGEEGPPHYALPTGNLRPYPPPWIKQEIREPDEAEKTRITLETFYMSEAARGEKIAAANATLDKNAAKKIKAQKEKDYSESSSTAEEARSDGSTNDPGGFGAAGEESKSFTDQRNQRPRKNSVRRLSTMGSADRPQVPSRSNSVARRRSSSLSHAGGQIQTEIYTILKKSAYNRTKKDNEKLLAAFRHMKAFEKLSDFILSEICSVVQCQTYESKKVVFRQGDVGTCWYVIYKGMVSVKISKSGVAEEMVEVARLGPGLGFGDLALVNDAARAATIVTVERCELLRVEKSDYNRVLKFIHLKAVEEKAYFLKQVPIFSSWRAASLKSVSDKVTWVKFPAGSVVIRSGSLVEKLYFVRTGICDIYQDLTIRVEPAKAERRRLTERGARVSNAGTKAVQENRDYSKKTPVSNVADALTLMTITEDAAGNTVPANVENDAGENATGGCGDRPTFKTVAVWLGEYQRYDYFGQECALGSDLAVWPPADNSNKGGDTKSESAALPGQGEASTPQVLSTVTVKARTDVELATIAAYDARAQVKSELSPSPYQNLTTKAVAERYAVSLDKKKWNAIKQRILVKTVRERYADPSIDLNDVKRMMETREAAGTSNGNGKHGRRWK